MLGNENIQKRLEFFRNIIIEESKNNLRKKKKVASGRLLNSIKPGKVKVNKDGVEVNIEMENYGEFIDKGVSGKKVKYDTPYSYTSKMPPPSSLDKWSVRRGIAPRDEKGRLLPRKSINFLIARSIFNKGIKPSLFFTTPFKRIMGLLPKELTEAFAIDIEKMLEQTFKANR